MPEDPSRKVPPASGTDSDFVLQNCVWSASGKLMTAQLWLPASMSAEEMNARHQHASDECRAWLEREHRDQKAQALQRLKEQEARDAATGLLTASAPSDQAKVSTKENLSKLNARGLDSNDDVREEREQLERAALDAQPLLVRSFDEVAATTEEGALGHLHVPVYAWDEPLKLIDRSEFTPDRDVHRRGKNLYHRIRANHPSQIRPVGYPLASHARVLGDLEGIGRQMPHFTEVLGFVRDSLALSHARKQPMRLPPILLLGDPGIGKTHFSIALAQALRVPMHRHGFDGSITDNALLGSDSHWANTSIGLMFEALVLGPSASPVILLDEIDKARKTERIDPVAPLHTLLEPVSAHAVTDISAKFTFNASHVVWIATGNEAAGVPSTIRSRFREFMIQEPQGEAAIRAAQGLAQAVHARMGQDLFDPLGHRIVVAVAHLPARQQIQSLEMAFARALANSSRTVHLHHLPPSVLNGQQGDDAQQTQDDADQQAKGYLH